MLHPREDYARIQDPAGLIPENEPVFLLRAQDKAAAGTVRFWAESNSRMGGDPELTKQALHHAKIMEAWPVKKLADLPAVPSAEQPTEQQTEQPAKQESKPDSGIVSEPAKQESKPDSGIVSGPQKSQNRDGSGVS